MDLRPGVQLDRYRLVRQAGSGGMGTVWKAEHTVLGTPYAIKVLHRAADAARLLREGRLQAGLRHPNLVGIIDRVEIGDGFGLVLEWVEGSSLQEWLSQHRPTAEQAKQIARGILEGLGALHQLGLVHRDLKPANVLLDSARGGIPRLTDFGLAKPWAQRDSQTVPGSLVGTPAYMAPEQTRNAAEVTPATDLYSFGAVLYELLTGRRAFPQADLFDIVQEVRLGRAVPLDPTVDPDLAELVHHCMAAEPTARPSSAEWILDRLTDASARSAATTLELLLEAPAPPTLPAELDSFFGREAELDRLADHFAGGAQLVTLWGPGGVGKTRLAARFGRRFHERGTGGVWFADLTEARSLEGVSFGLARALRVPLTEDDTVGQLGRTLRALGPCLVVLDNFEQVARFGSETVGRWRCIAPEVGFLVTSREVLGLQDELVLTLDPLPDEVAVALFQARSGAHTEDGATLLDLVRSVDRLPLAIEILAAHGGGSPASAVLLLSARASGRHANLQVVLDWSWDLLGNDERCALAQLSVFEGGATPEAAGAVLDCPEPVQRIEALVRRSLVRDRDGRVGLLVSVHTYASAMLDERGERVDAEIRHGRYYAQFGTDEALALSYNRGGDRVRSAWMAEADNLTAACRRAIARGDGEIAVNAVVALQEAQEWGWMTAATTAQLAREARDLPSLTLRERARCCFVVGVTSSNSSEAQDQLRAAEEMARALGDQRAEADVWAKLGWLQLTQGAHADAEVHIVRALTRYREQGRLQFVATALNKLAILEQRRGRLVEARSLWNEVLAIDIQEVAQHTRAFASANLATALYELGELNEARELLVVALADARQRPDRHLAGSVLAKLGQLALLEGRLSDADKHFSDSLGLLRTTMNAGFAGFVEAHLAALCRRRGDPDAAARHLRRGEDLATEVGDRRVAAIVARERALLHHTEGRDDESRQAFRESEAGFRAMGDRVGLAKVLALRSRCTSERGPADEDADLAESSAIAAEIGLGPDGEVGRLLAEARAARRGGGPRG